MGWGLLTGLALVLAVVSCRKDDSSSSQPPDSPEANKLKEWYQSKMAVSGENPFSKMKPRWNSLYVNENSSQRVYEIELENPERVLAKLGRPDRSTLGREEKRHMIRLLIFENRLTSKILYASYMSVESGSGTVPKDLHYKKVGAFSGTVLFYHFGGALSNGWDYENGKITRQITAISKSDFDLLSQSGPKGKLMAQVTTCSSGFAEKYRWSCVGVSGYEKCGWTSAGTEYVTVCTTRETSDVPNQDDDGGPSGDYIPPIYIDCAGVENGSAYWNTECKTCMGGTTGIDQCPIKQVDVDPNARPCLAAIKAKLEALGLKNTSKEAGLIADVLNKLNLSIGSNFNAIINEKAISTNFVAQTIEITNPNSTWGTQGLVSEISFNSTYLDKMTDLAVAATMMHEYVHAYFEWNFHLMERGQVGYDVNFVNTYKLLFDKNGNPDNTPNAHHEQMAVSFAGSISAMLKQYADSKGIAYPADPDYFKKMGWSGLTDTNAGKYAPAGATYTIASETGQGGVYLSKSLNCTK